MLFHPAVGLQLAVNPLVDFLAGPVIRRHYQGLLGALGVSLGDGVQALLPVRDLMLAALLPETLGASCTSPWAIARRCVLTPGLSGE